MQWIDKRYSLPEHNEDVLVLSKDNIVFRSIYRAGDFWLYPMKFNPYDDQPITSNVKYWGAVEQLLTKDVLHDTE